MVEMGGYKGRLEAIIFYVTSTYEFLIHAMYLIFYEKVEMDGYKGRLEAIVFFKKIPWYLFKRTALVCL